MKSLRSILLTLLVFVFVAGLVAFTIVNYSWVFAKHVKGEILDVQRVMNPTAILGKATDDQIHSYSILIKGEDGRLYTSSSDDRQWQVARKGYCVDALLYVYPPWELKNAGTFFNARLNALSFCPGKGEPPAEAPGTPAQPNATPPSPNGI